MPTKTKKNSNTSEFIEEVINSAISNLNIKTIKNEEYFMPLIKEVNRIRIPSTPFNYTNGSPIFLGDVFLVEFEEESDDTETYLAELIYGQYIATSANPNKDAPLHFFHDLKLTALGSSVINTELLTQLTQ